MAAGISNGIKSLSSSATTHPRAGVGVTESCYHVKAIGWPMQNEFGWSVSVLCLVDKCPQTKVITNWPPD